MLTMRAIALDVGGSSVKSGIVSLDDHVVSGFETDPIDSYAGSEEILSSLTCVIQVQLARLEQAGLAGLGIAFPGPFDYPAGICRMQGVSPRGGPGTPGKFDAIYGLDLRVALHARLGLAGMAIQFRNDAEAAIAGEAKYGSGAGCRRLIGVTLGTGFGSAFLLDGERQADGPGLPPDGWLFQEVFAGRAADDLFSTRGLLERLAGQGTAYENLAMAAHAARSGNLPARLAFVSFGTELGQFMRPYALAFSAEAILVLGGIASTFDLFGSAMANELLIPVRVGMLGASAALLGAVDGLEAWGGSRS